MVCFVQSYFQLTNSNTDMKVIQPTKTGKRISVASRPVRRSIQFRSLLKAGGGLVEMDGVKYRILNNEIYRAYRLLERSKEKS